MNPHCRGQIRVQRRAEVEKGYNGAANGTQMLGSGVVPELWICRSLVGRRSWLRGCRRAGRVSKWGEKWMSWPGARARARERERERVSCAVNVDSWNSFAGALWTDKQLLMMIAAAQPDVPPLSCLSSVSVFPTLRCDWPARATSQWRKQDQRRSSKICGPLPSPVTHTHTHTHSTRSRTHTHTHSLS